VRPRSESKTLGVPSSEAVLATKLGGSQRIQRLYQKLYWWEARSDVLCVCLLLLDNADLCYQRRKEQDHPFPCSVFEINQCVMVWVKNTGQATRKKWNAMPVGEVLKTCVLLRAVIMYSVSWAVNRRIINWFIGKDDAVKHFSKDMTCPACEKPLSSRDIRQVDLSKACMEDKIVRCLNVSSLNGL